MKKILKEWLPYVIIIIIVILIRTYVITPVIVRGSSMENTLHEGEVLLLSKISYKINDIKRYDIVVIKDKDNDYIIKRIIGIPGDNVEYINNTLYINNKKIKENFSIGETKEFTLKEICEINDDDCSNGIPKGKYLVLGDNRDVSADSIIKGLIDKEQITGKTIFRLWPLNKLKIIK